MPAAKTRKPSGIVHDTTLPEIVQAASIALQVLKKVKVHSWEKLAAAMDPSTRHPEAPDPREIVTLTDNQQDLLDRYDRILPYLAYSPTQVLFACQACGRYGFATGKAISSKCLLTTGCTGKVVRAGLMPPKQPNPASSTPQAT